MTIKQSYKRQPTKFDYAAPTQFKFTITKLDENIIKQIIKIRKYTLKYGYDFNEYISTQIVREFPKYNFIYDSSILNIPENKVQDITQIAVNNLKTKDFDTCVAQETSGSNLILLHSKQPFYNREMICAIEENRDFLILEPYFLNRCLCW